MEYFDIAIACISLAVIVLGLMYKKLKTSILNETLLSMLFGILLGAQFFDVFKIVEWGNVNSFMEKACRLTLSMALMATAFRIPVKYIHTGKKEQAVLLLLVMPAMFLTSALIIHFITGTTWTVSLLAGAMITPTDPVLAGTVIAGEMAKDILPQQLRNALSFESGANDGLAFPFVMLGLFLVNETENLWQTWLMKTWLWETAGGIALGVLLGYLFGHLLEYCIKKNYTAKPAVLAFALSVAFFILTALELIGVNSILSVFVAGIMMKKSLGRHEEIEEEEIQEMMARLFTIPIFIFLGLILPWQQWFQLGWKAFLLPPAILLFRRLPFVLAAKPLLKSFTIKELAFMGWFGPMGAAAMFYSFYSTKTVQLHQLWPIVSLVVFSSVVIHGITAYPFLKWYKKEMSRN